MTEVPTSAQMRAAERAAIAAGRTTGAALMEAAGAAVVAAIGAQWPDLAARPGVAAVLCGPGNNGGDGFVIARLLQGLGWRVRVALMGDPARLPPDAAANLARWRALGGLADWPPAPDPADLVVDALFGTGLARPVDLPPGWPPAGARVVAVDVPSGLCADSGRPAGGQV
ncbi:MAG: NAD(P)H-hydrate epimerase, partial [Rhodobacterales bacterium]|nr:NAD(P)H-hydrate epimerase [Rhodobacterales bacterium]